MKHYLPIEPDSIIKSRQSNALQLSVIQARLQGEKFLSWLSGEFINVIYNTDAPLKYDFLRDDFWFTGQKLIAKQHINFKNSVLNYKSFDAIKYICEMINNGSYIMGDFNAFYVRQKAEYNILNRNIDYLIYGYDDDSRTFSMLGDIRDSIYSPFSIGFDEYLNAVGNREDELFNLNVITFNQDKEHKISLPLIYRKLRDYLLSECSDVQRYNPSIIYGINTWERFRQELKGLAGIDSYFDNRSFMVLTEHKQIMMLRVEYLIREGILSDVKILEQCRQVYEKALEAVEICTKYNKQRDFSQLGILDRILKEIVYIEKLYISIILENINSVYSVKSG